MQEYLIVINGKPEGPYPGEQLKEMGLNAESFVKAPGMIDYKEAREVPELCELLGISQQTARPQYFASMDVRLLAVVIDYLIIFFIYCILATIVVLFLGSREYRIAAALGGLVIIPAAKLICSIILEASPKQATWGKAMMGIRVTDEEGAPITAGRSFARNLSKILCAATLGIGYLIGFFDKRQQCLHDRIGGTLVVRDRLI